MKNLYKIKKDLYVISNTEDVNDNDYIITKDDRLIKVSYLLSDEVAKGFKVILTTNDLLIKDGVQDIDNEFLEWFSSKNGNVNFVEVISLRKSSGWYDEKEIWHWDFLGYKIIIPKEEHKQGSIVEAVKEVISNQLQQVEELRQETLEEIKVIKRTELYNSILSIVKQIPRKEVEGDAIDAPSCAYELEQLFLKWQQEKMYSEEEVLKIIDLLFHKYASSFRVDAKEDFLLSKKK